MMQVLDTGAAAAQVNMDRDKNLLDSLNPDGDPILHIYDWEAPSLTYGYFIDPKEYLNLEKTSLYGVSIGRRPTGGGIVFHTTDFAFSLLVPSSHSTFSRNTLENYHFVNSIVREVVSSLFDIPQATLTLESFTPASAACAHFCMARPTQYDVVHNGRKIAGAAQRKKAQGYLHQGTISLRQPDVTFLRELLLPDSGVPEAMASYSFSPLRVGEDVKTAKQKILERLVEKLMEKL